MEDRVELRAMDVVRRYYESRNWEVENVSRARGVHGGYDFLVKRGSELLTVEVKGCTRAYGIPDPYHTEFDPNSRQMIADVMCVVYFLSSSETPQLAIIPREAILPEYVVPKFGYRISGRFKNARKLNQFFVEIEARASNADAG